MAILTPEKFENLNRDIDDTGKAINIIGIITPRYGEPFKSLPLVSKEAENRGGYISAPTLTALQAIVPSYNWQLAREDSTGDEYRWNPAASPNPKWEPTGRNYIKDAKSYIENLIDTNAAPYDYLEPYVDSSLKIAGDIHADGGSSVAVSNYTYVLNKSVAGSKIKAVVIQSPLVGSRVTIKVFVKGTDRFTFSRTVIDLTMYKAGFNYFVLPSDKVITLAANEFIGFSTASANLNYKLVSSAANPYYYNANSATATEVLLSSAGSTAEIQVGFFSEAKTAIVTNYVVGLSDEIARIRSDLYSIEVIGKKDTPDSGTNNANSAQWIPDKPVASSGVLSKFSTFSAATGNVEVCVYVKSGTKDFTVRTSQMLPVVSGLNTFNLDIPVSEGEYVGIKTYIAGLTRYTQSSDTSQTFAVYSHTDLNATTGFAGPTGGYIWQYNFEVLSKDEGEVIPPKWDGLKYTSFGDSITWYNGRAFVPSHIEAGQIAKGYQSYIVDALGCTLDNKGESGWTMPRIYNERISVYDFADTYLTTITSGANDQRTGVPIYPGYTGNPNDPAPVLAPIGGPFNTNTYTGAMQAAIEHVIASNPATKIVLITPIRGWFNEYNTSNVPNPNSWALGVIKPLYADMVIAIGKLYGLPVIDFYYDTQLNDLNKSYFLGDNPEEFTAYLLHPMNRFFQRMGEIALATLKNL
ncbi:SGNH/GDSL hydrolase family protein [Acinetobacter baumannii]|nr:SGNH/GDSL hydrolase family protein [Acinetobacter baumannii]